jgi:hypothetical protein
MNAISEIQMSSITGGDVIGAFCVGYAVGVLAFPFAGSNPFGLAVGIGCAAYGLYNLIID